MVGHFKNAAWGGAVTGFRALFGLANALLAVRLVGVEIYGQLAVCLSLFVLYLALNTSLFTVLVTRLMCPEIAQNKIARGEILASMAYLTTCSIAFLVLMTGLTFWVVPSLSVLAKFQGMDTALLIMGVLATLQIIAAFQAAIIEAAGRLDLAMRAQLLGPFLLLGMLSTSYLLHISLNAEDYVIMLCVSAGVDLGLLWLIRRHGLRLMVLQADAQARMARVLELFRSGGVLQATALMNLFLEPLNKFLLSYFVGPAAVTAYDMAMKVIWGIQGLFGAAMRVFLHFAYKDGAAVGRAYGQAIALLATPALLAHAVGAILLSWVATSWVNMNTEQLVFFYAIATLSNLGMIFITPLYVSLISRGDMGFIFKSQTILAFVNTVASILAIPVLGFLGAAIGLLIATAYNAMAIYIRHSHIVARLEGVAKIFRSVAARFSTTLLLFIIVLYMGVQGDPVIIWSVVLLVALFLIGITEPLTRRLWDSSLPTVITIVKGRKR